MKKYHSIGELFKDYRDYNYLSQADFANNIDVDLRTVQRWEKDLTLIKSGKVEDIILETLMPYQLVLNLNASIPIPTFYDLNTRKYSLTERTNELPNASWFKEKIEITANNLRLIDFDFDIKHIEHFIVSQKKDESYVNNDLIKEAIRILPELNFVLIGESGYYAGHCLVLPLKNDTYKRLRNRELTSKDLRASDLGNYNLLERPIFYIYSITADCNDSLFYVMTEFLRFFRDIENRNYVLATYTERDDSSILQLQLGMVVIWEDKTLQKELGLEFPPRFIEGDFNQFLSSLEK